MKILLVNTTAHTGGASIACARLMEAPIAQGHEVRLVVRSENFASRVRFVWERLLLLPHIPYARVFSIDDGRCGTDLTTTEDFRWADVVHLHWVNQAMLSIDGIGRLLRRCREEGKRVVWTMHDIWPATGICHLPGDCTRWLEGCGNCPLLRSPKSNDLSARTFCKKAKAYAEGSIHFVACSQYLAKTAMKSPLLQQHTVANIANPLDTDFFSPAADADSASSESRKSIRAALQLPQNKRLVLFVAYNVNDENKGFRFVAKAVGRLLLSHPTMKDRIAVVPVGKNATQWIDKFACEVCPFEYVGDRETMRSLYRASDVLVISSKMENLPNTIVEAKACGLPVVAPSVGGIPEMIRHKVDGFLAEPYSLRDEGQALVASLAEGLHYILKHPDYSALSVAARADAVATYSEAAVVRRYEQLYK